MRGPTQPDNKKAIQSLAWLAQMEYYSKCAKKLADLEEQAQSGDMQAIWELNMFKDSTKFLRNFVGDK